MTQPERRLSMIAAFRGSAQLMVAELVTRLAVAGYPDISGTHHPVFENIDLRGTRLSVLAARANLTHQSMSELVRTLENRGYVERIPDPSDGRARIVRLTPKGLHMIRRATREIALVEAEWESYWPGVGSSGDLRGALLEALNRAQHEADHSRLRDR